ncbi:CRISPR-associated endonuclease Cas2 [Crocinitomicaceae bacterium CZZ-1]|uniref:CRISPR-associated endoribonuclease Cas2 n=1 Tax=Taishania pollutisoli TaxID=2766479 RepID=A0A8J6PLC7_9FLAO|nr:CRISPR-associated endonuclease Cas2 [Taishania pollutisoli]MBC9812915.1 CRISPR-associated endonuclease Cas2 [Taishania pollutisoli]
MDTSRFNAYRTMWVMVLFDLPTETKKERRDASQFRKKLLESGFMMFQFSIYMRFCQSMENAEMHTKRVKNILPEKGKVGIFAITDKQFSRMEIFHGVKKQETNPPAQQLTLF